MKTKYFILLALGALGFSSCQKDFDPASYAPALNIGGYTSSDQVAPTNLVAYWSFDGNFNESKSNTVGTNAGTTFAVGVKGQALKGALNAYVTSNTPTAVQGLKSFTISCWENMPLNDKGIVGLVDISNTTAFWGNMTVFFENGGTAASGNLKIHVNNNGVDNWLGNYAMTSPWDKWNHIVISYDQVSSTYKVYVNGSKIATQIIAGNGPLTFQNASKMVFGTVHFQTTPSLTTGTGKQDWASYLVGMLDEVRIYNKALSDDEISSLAKLEGRGK
ncbi:MAG: LamG domain-containing protein [Pedobacter sp.]|jgi:hypothetical protein|uniref:LamG domain-containing protein n=1 Tax=Pedobacter sp. TaxID=1411316 RepID=UPI003562AF68